MKKETLQLIPEKYKGSVEILENNITNWKNPEEMDEISGYN
jgi:hypothetical protein